MKIFLIILLASIGLHSQIIFEANIHRADVNVYVENSVHRADLKVYVVDNMTWARGNEGLWYFDRRRHNQNISIHFVENRHRADFTIFYVRNHRAGWKDLSKKRLFSQKMKE